MNNCCADLLKITRSLNLFIAAAMYKILCCAGLLFAAFSLHAQSSDKIITDNEPAFAAGVDEKAGNLPSGNARTPDLLSSLQLLKGKNVAVSKNLTGKKRGIILINQGDTELVSAGFKRNDLYGVWLSRYENGKLIDSGRFINNIPDGEWRTWYQDGTLRTVRTYNAYKWHAIQAEIARGNTRIFNYQVSKMLLFKPASFAVLTSAGGSFPLVEGEKKKYQPPFRYCLHHGLYMDYYPNGLVKDSGYYKDGLRDGMWNEYYPNGILSAQGSYFRGVKNGGWKFLNPDGRLVMLAEYRHGKMLFRKHYPNTGK